MCEFCENIAYTDEEFRRANIKCMDFIFKSDNGYAIYTDTGDSFCPGILKNIRFCPMCGRELCHSDHAE